MLHKVITLANFKGGVGKSTSTAAIGACLAMKGYKVLLVHALLCSKRRYNGR